MRVTVYSFLKASGESATDYTTQSPAQAKRYAYDNDYNVTANEYEYADSEPVMEWQYATAAAEGAVAEEDDT